MVQPSKFQPGPSQKSGCVPSNLANASSYALRSAGDISGSVGVTATLFRSAGTFLAWARCSDPNWRVEEGRRGWCRLGENDVMGRAAGNAAEAQGAEDSKRALAAAVAIAAIALLLVETREKSLQITSNGEESRFSVEKRAKPSTRHRGLDFIHPWFILFRFSRLCK